MARFEPGVPCRQRITFVRFGKRSRDSVSQPLPGSPMNSNADKASRSLPPSPLPPLIYPARARGSRHEGSMLEFIEQFGTQTRLFGVAFFYFGWDSSSPSIQREELGIYKRHVGRALTCSILLSITNQGKRKKIRI